MRRLAIAITLGAAALLGSFSANAADNLARKKAVLDTAQSTEFSSQHRRHHRHHSRHHRRHHGGYAYAPGGYYAPRAYYAPQPYYYGGGPSIGFGFGGGHFGGHHHGHHGHHGHH